MDYFREKVVEKARSWIGKNEADGSYKEIIDVYNKNVSKTPRKLKMLYSWPWCACFWSAVAFSLGYEKIVPVEMSCAELVKISKKKGIWVEDDTYIPLPGDAILYDWSDSGKGDCVGPPDHIGIVEYVNKKSGYIVVIEGNYSNSVKRRTVSINGVHIRGFITPEYVYKKTDLTYMEKGKDVDTVAREVISGVWGNGEDRKNNLKQFGYDPKAVQDRVNEILNGSADKPSTSKPDQNRPTENKITASTKAKKFAKSVSGTYVTTSNVYLRNDSGSNKKALCLIPKNTKVSCYGYYNLEVKSKTQNIKWLYIQVVINDVLYTGFSCGTYLRKV